MQNVENLKVKKLFDAEDQKPTLEERKARRDHRNRNRNPDLR